MTDKALRKLNRAQLLELLLEQSREIDRLQGELDQAQKDLEDRRITLDNCGSIAEASIVVSRVFEEAQKAADQYLENVKRVIDEKAAKEEPLPVIKSAEFPEEEAVELEIPGMEKSQQEEEPAQEPQPTNNTSGIKGKLSSAKDAVQRFKDQTQTNVGLIKDIVTWGRK